MRTITHAKRGLVVSLATALALAVGSVPAVSLAEESLNDLQEQADSLVEKVEETTAAYQQAEEEVERVEGEIAANEQRRDDLEEQLPAQRARTAASIKSMYLFQQSQRSLFDIILSADTFEDFISTMRYMDAIHLRNTTEIEALTAMEDELTQTMALLEVEHDAALQKREDAASALEDARAARLELQVQAIAIAQSEAGSRDEAIRIASEALAKAGDAEATFVTSSGNTAQIQVPTSSSVSTDPLVTNTTSAEASDWAARINAYLEGSPLAGYGQTFADAAAAYGVDPRLSPAIATIESGKGTYCFKDYNAWGWGSSSWSSWEDAIYDQVAGLAKGYNGTLTYEGAQKYCPPNADAWYSSVATQMDNI